MPKAKLTSRSKGSKEKFVETTHVDVTEKQIEDFTLGDEVEITIKGTIGMLSLPHPNTPFPEDESPSMGIEVTSKTVKAMSKDEKNIKDLAEDEDDD